MLLTVDRKERIEYLVDRNKATMARSGSSAERNEIQHAIDIVETFLNHAIVVEIEDECYCDMVHPDTTCGYCLSKNGVGEKELVY